MNQDGEWTLNSQTQISCLSGPVLDEERASPSHPMGFMNQIEFSREEFLMHCMLGELNDPNFSLNENQIPHHLRHETVSYGSQSFDKNQSIHVENFPDANIRVQTSTYTVNYGTSEISCGHNETSPTKFGSFELPMEACSDPLPSVSASSSDAVQVALTETPRPKSERISVWQGNSRFKTKRNFKQRHLKRIKLSPTSSERAVYVHLLKAKFVSMCKEIKKSIIEYVEKTEQCPAINYLQECIMKCNRHIYYFTHSLEVDDSNPQLKYIFAQKQKGDLWKKVLDAELDLYHAEMTVVGTPDALLSRMERLKNELHRDKV